MTRVNQLVWIVLVSISSSGCYQPWLKPDVPKYEFQKIDTSGVYIDMKSKEVQRVCTPSLLELNEVYQGIIGFYDYQIDSYNESNRSR